MADSYVKRPNINHSPGQHHSGLSLICKVQEVTDKSIKTFCGAEIRKTDLVTFLDDLGGQDRVERCEKCFGFGES